MVLKLERQYNATHVDESKVLINVSDARKFSVKGNRGAGVSNMSGKSSDYKNKECSHCGRICRPIDVCYIRNMIFPQTMGKLTLLTIPLLNKLMKKRMLMTAKAPKKMILLASQGNNMKNW